MDEHDSQQNQNGHQNGNPVTEPRFIVGRAGTRLYSQAAIVERIVSAFELEYPEDSEARHETVSKSDQLRLLRDTLQYVLAVESLQLTTQQQADLTRQAYSEIFGYGPLDALFEDPTITTITLEGIEKIAVRYGHGDLTKLEPVFEDREQFERTIQRLAQQAGAEIMQQQPYLEIGLAVETRPVCVNLVLPPASLVINADIRVHPPTIPELSTLVDAETAQELLISITRSPHGVLIIGETESGKTTLLSMLAQHLSPEGLMSIERAGELRLPEGAQRKIVQWPTIKEAGISFAQHIADMVDQVGQRPACVLLDEVRADEHDAVLPLLTTLNPPRMLWTFRGQADPKRLSAALGILARRVSDQSETTLHALYQRLPFVIALRRRNGKLFVSRISEWQYNSNSTYPSLVELMAHNGETLALTGPTPLAALGLSADFWLQDDK
jgi:type IV secretory pathway ATPase VirB11/archaellum biosynthesis ATPase